MKRQAKATDFRDCIQFIRAVVISIEQEYERIHKHYVINYRDCGSVATNAALAGFWQIHVDRYLEKGMGLMALTGRRPAEIFFSASFSLPREKLPYPALLFDGQLKTRQAPGTSFEPYLIPVLAEPKKLVQALDRLRSLKSFPSPEAVNTTTGPQLPKYVSAAFGSLDQPWKPGHLRSAYGAVCCHMFKPKNITDDIFLAQILGHKLLGPNASLSVGQSYKDFYIR